jgi:23S rRNA-/tRNA-specific pseudouridylate synthase
VIKIVIETGRTHQIRAHLKSVSMPILGDKHYGGRDYKRVMLHSFRISLLGYAFEAKEPKEFQKALGG